MEEDQDREEEKDESLQAKFISDSAALHLQRQMTIGEEETEPIQAKSAGSMADSFEAGANVETQLSLSKGRGSPLPGPVRAFMEPRFRVDFSHVHVHTGSDALQMSQAVGAKAFTHGSDIYFGEGHSPTNLELTAHELTHVVQQTGGAPLQTQRRSRNSIDNADFSIQQVCAVCGEDRIARKESIPKSANATGMEEKPANKTSLAPKQTADAVIASPPKANKENKTLPALDEGPSKKGVSETAKVNENLQPPANREKAPASPEEDSAYQAVVEQLKIKSNNEKTPSKEPEKKQVETKLAANLTPEEIEKENAYGNHLDKLEQVQPHELTVEMFMGEFKATTTKLAEKLPENKEKHGTVQTAVELSAAKIIATQEVANQRKAYSDPLLKEAAKNASDYQDNKKQASKTYELKVDPVGSTPTIKNAKNAAPKPKTDDEISLDDKSRDLDAALLNHDAHGQTINIDEGSLAFPISGEKTFDEAGEAKRKAQDEIKKAKPRYREQERGIISQSQDDIQSLVNTGLQGQHDSRSNSFNEVLGAQKSHGSNIEEKKRSVFNKYQGIYEDKKSKVNEELKKLNSIEGTFASILSKAEERFEDMVRKELEYIYTPGILDYSDWKGIHEDEINKEREKLLSGGEDSYSAHYTASIEALRIVQGRSAEIYFGYAKREFISNVNMEVEEKIANKVVEALNAAKKHIEDGKDKVKQAFDALGPEEQKETENVLVAVMGKFETLEESVEDRQREIIDDMARTYNQNVGKLKATFDEIKKDVLTSWLEKAWNKLKAIVNAIIDFATRIAELLGRIAYLVGDIVSSPRYFFSNLVTGIGQGFSTFVEQIDEFLATAFFDWLRGSSGLAIQLPKDGGPKGIFSLFTQLLNLGTETIWERMEVVYDKTIANTFRRGEAHLDNGLEIFGVIKNEGLGGLWDEIKNSLGNILEETLEMIEGEHSLCRH